MCTKCRNSRCNNGNICRTNSCAPKCDPCNSQPKRMYCGRPLPCVGVLKGQDLDRVIELFGDEICQMKQVLELYNEVRFQENPDCPTEDGFIIEIYNPATDEVVASRAVCGTTLYYETTIEEFNNLVGEEGLIAGATYGITDIDEPLYGGTLGIFSAVSETEIDSNGVGVFYNPIYDESDNYKKVWSDFAIMEVAINDLNDIIPLNSNIIADNGATGILIGDGIIRVVSGDWSGVTSYSSGGVTNGVIYVSSTPSYSVDDKIVYGGRVWRNKTGNIGTAVDDFQLDTTNWEIIPYNTTDYNKVYDSIKYNVKEDRIIRREDVTLNIVERDIQGQYPNSIKEFQWGREAVTGNKVSSGSTFVTINSSANYVAYNVISDQSYVDLNNTIRIEFNSNIIDSNSYFGNNYITDSSISKNTLSNGSSFRINTCNPCHITNNSFSVDTLVEYNRFYNIYISNNDFIKSTVDYNELVSNGYFTNNTFNTAGFRSNKSAGEIDVKNNRVEKLSSISNNDFNTDVYIDNNILENYSNIDYNKTVFVDDFSGRVKITFNNLTNKSSIQLNEVIIPSSISDNLIENESTIRENTYDKTDVKVTPTMIEKNKLANDSSINSNKGDINIKSNILENKSDIFNNTMLLNVMIEENILTNNSRILSNTFSEILKLTGTSYIVNNYLDDKSAISNNTLLGDSSISRNNLSTGCLITDCSATFETIQGEVHIDENIARQGSIIQTNSGNITVSRNLLEGQSTITGNRFYAQGTINYNKISSQSRINGNSLRTENTEVNHNVLVNFSEILNNNISQSLIGGYLIRFNSLENNSSISNNSILDDGRIERNNLDETSSIKNNTMTLPSFILTNDLKASSTIASNTITEGVIAHNEIIGVNSLVSNIGITNNNLAEDARISNNVMRESKIDALDMTPIAPYKVVEHNTLIKTIITDIPFTTSSTIWNTKFVDVDTTGIDFSSSSTIYGVMYKEVIKTSTGTQKISYIDGTTNAYVIVDIDA